jgi:hypothetical protein
VDERHDVFGIHRSEYAGEYDIFWYFDRGGSVPRWVAPALHNLAQQVASSNHYQPFC